MRRYSTTENRPPTQQLLEPKTYVLTAMLALFVGLAFWAGTRHVLPGDLRFTNWVQGLDWPLLDPLTAATNRTMSGVPLTISAAMIAIVLYLLRFRLEAGVLAATLVIRLANGIVKLIVESPRPDSELVAVTDAAHGFGHPSGHASAALLVVGALAWIVTRHEERPRMRRLIWAFAIFWIVLTGIARIRVGVHWPSDVLSAWLWSLPALVLITRVAERFEGSRNRVFARRLMRTSGRPGGQPVAGD